MLFNFTTRKPYKINLDELFSIMDSVLNSQDNLPLNTKDMIEQWKKVLYNAYMHSGTYLSNQFPPVVLSELFQKQICFETFDLILNFDIEYLDKNIGSAPIVTANLNDCKLFSLIDYVHIPESTLNIKNISEKPIYIIPYMFADTDYILVDGNHRLCAKFKAGAKSVNIAVFPIWESANCLLNKFEQAFLCYTYEVRQYYGMALDGIHYIDKQKSLIRNFSAFF